MTRIEPQTNAPAAIRTQFTSTATKRAIMAQFSPAAAKSIVPKAELETLKRLRAEIGRLSEMDGQLTFDASRKAYRQHISDFTTAVSTGQNAVADDRNMWSHEDWIEDFAERRRVVRQHRAAKLSEVIPLAKACRARWAEAAMELGREVALAEQAIAEKFCVTHSPSATVLAIYSAADEMAGQIGGDSVEAMLPFVSTW